MTDKLPVVLTCKEYNIPRDYKILGRLTSGDVVVVHRPFSYALNQDITDKERASWLWKNLSLTITI